MKLATIEGFWPELRGKHIYATGRGRGSTAKAAISRAIADILKAQRGKRWTSFKATITVVEMSTCSFCKVEPCVCAVYKETKTE
jgi:hypothetical protein